MSKATALQAWEYHDPTRAAVAIAVPSLKPEAPRPQAPGFTEVQVEARVEAALAEARQLWLAEAEAMAAAQRVQVQDALADFAKQRTAYFRQAEREVVQLSLAIARKILQREAQLDPDLLGAMVRIALDRMGAGTAVRVLVPVADLVWWQRHTEILGPKYECVLVGDETLRPGDCVVQADLGQANFGIEAQLIEVEQGIRALMQLRPEPAAADTPHQQSAAGATEAFVAGVQVS